jgi:hypothetical protein
LIVVNVYTQAPVSGKVSFPNHSPNTGSITCQPVLYEGDPVYNVNINFQPPSPAGQVTFTSGSGGFTGSVTPGMQRIFPGSYQQNAVAWKNGVATDDHMTLQQHILNITPIFCPFRLLAGDMNNSGTITTFDLIRINALLLNNTIPVEIPGKPWRMVPKSIVIPDPISGDVAFTSKFWSLDPFGAILKRNGKTYTYLGLPGVTWMDSHDALASTNSVNPVCYDKMGFFAVKMGDINGNPVIANIQNIFFAPEEGPEISFKGPAIEKTLRSVLQLQANERYEIKVIVQSEKESICGYQVGIGFDDASLSFEKSKPNRDKLKQNEENNFTTNKELLEKGDFRATWTIDYATEKTGLETVREVELFAFNLKAKKDIAKLSEAIFLSRANIETKFYNYSAQEIKDVKVTFNIRQLRDDEE